MAQSDEIKIRALPRGSEKTEKEGKSEPKSAPKKSPRWIVYVGTVGCLLLVFQIATHRSYLAPVSGKVTRAKIKSPKSGQMDLNSVNGHINESVTRHLQDSEIKQEMMKRTREIENLPYKNAINEPNDDDSSTLPDTRNYGVQMDSDESAERVYEDLNGRRPTPTETPGDRINSRLANRKWMNEMERAERIEFIGNFIRTAYDRGYEVELDQNLVVVGIKPISGNRHMNINQVMDRLAKQGY